MNLPGVPKEEEVKTFISKHKKLPPIHHDIFPLGKYKKLRKQLLKYVENNLLAKHNICDAGKIVASKIFRLSRTNKVHAGSYYS